MLRRAIVVFASVSLLSATAWVGQGRARPLDPPLPGSIAAIGDSITQAFDVCCFYGAYPQRSWATGYRRGDRIVSHYERIAIANPAIRGHFFNDSVTGADMADADGQAGDAVAQAAEYVTIEMGANDLCTSSVETMTDPAVFQSEFEDAMAILESGLPSGAHIFVATIPDIYNLWSVLHDNPVARAVWDLTQICQSMLSEDNTEADRQQVVVREQAFNGILQDVCQLYANCLFDADAVYGYKFPAAAISTLDYFHPGVSGQSALATVSWAASWWPAHQ